VFIAFLLALAHYRSMPNRSRNVESSQFVTITTRKQSKLKGRKSIMAEMGSKGGKIGGKRRAENMTAEERKASASLAARACWGIKPTEREEPDTKAEFAKKFAALLEQNMDNKGLSQAEKDREFSEIVAYIEERAANQV